MGYYEYRQPQEDNEAVVTYLKIARNGPPKRRPLIDNEGLTLEEGNDVA